MPDFPVSQSKENELLERLAALGIQERDLEEVFIRGSGSGGQKINKTSSCVQLTHKPSGVQVRCQQGRSQAMNRFMARRELCDKLEAHQTGQVQKQLAKISKIRRQKARRSRKNKLKMLEGKKKRSAVKQQRSKKGIE